MKPKFSIITVSYNSEATIERTIKSVLNQSYKNYEYIIIDGASTDNTNTIIEKYKTSFKSRLKHISEPDNGIYDAMNKGIKLGKGDIICLLNSDDYYFDDTLSVVNEAYSNSNMQTVISGELIFKSEAGEQLLKTSEKRFKKIMKQYKNGVRHPATFVPKVIYDKIGLFNLDYKIGSDAELMFRIFRANYVFKFINRPLLVMSDGGVSNSKGVFKQLLKENKKLLNLYCPSKVLRLYFTCVAILRLAVKEVTFKFSYIYRKIQNH